MIGFHIIYFTNKYTVTKIKPQVHRNTQPNGCKNRIQNTSGLLGNCNRDKNTIEMQFITFRKGRFLFKAMDDGRLKNQFLPFPLATL